MEVASVDLKALFNKLGHKLEEIRVRALKSLLSKLQNGLLCDEDLVQERHLLIRLLEWFNFPSCPQQQEVLQLLQTLTKYEAAARLVLEVGGAEFLTQLRPNVEPSLHTLVNTCLDQLFHLTPSLPPTGQVTECIYKSTAPCSQTGSVANQSQTSVWSTKSAQTVRSLPPCLPVHGPGLESVPDHHVSPPDSHAGYFGHQGTHHTTQSQNMAQLPGAMAACFNFSTFPWVALTPTDRHVLSSTDMSLRNKEPSLVVSACEFLSDIVFQDFPAEVFLQRPSIIKNLLSLASINPADGSRVAEHAIYTLRDLAICLEGRIAFYQDPALYSPKQDLASSMTTLGGSSTPSPYPGSSDSRPSVVGRSDGHRPRGDGQDGDRSTRTSLSSSPGLPDVGMYPNHPLEELDYEETGSLQFAQWTLPQFCASVLQAVTPSLTSASVHMVRSSLELLYHVKSLLAEAVNPDDLWHDNSVPATELVEKFHECFELLSDAVHHHHHSSLSPLTPDSELSEHRVNFLGVAVFVADLVQLLVPVDKVELALPEMTHCMLSLLCQDASLAFSHGEVIVTLLPYLQRLDPDAYQNYMEAKEIIHSIDACTDFLNKWPEQLSTNMLDLVSLAEAALPSLPYHNHLPFVQAAVNLVSQVSRKSSPNPVAVMGARKALLHLLAHPLDEIRSCTYTNCLDIVMESLGVEHVTEPASTASQGLAFLLHHYIFYEICCFGMNDSVKKVEEAAGQIMLHLLQGQLLMSSGRWQHLLSELLPVLSILQSYATLEKGLGGCIFGLLETEAHIQTGTLPLHERFRGTLRLMYRHETRIRSEALGRLAWFLTQEEEGVRKLPQFSDLQVANFADILLVGPGVSLVNEDTSRSVFQREGLERVHNIFVGDGIEDDIRKSAVDQLAIMLQDPELHEVFLMLDGHMAVLRHLYTGVRKAGPGTQNPSQKMLPSLLKILRHLVQRNFSLRHELAQESAVYYTVLRCALLFTSDDDARSEASQLLALLLWDEVTSITSWMVECPAEGEIKKGEVTFSLPAIVTNRYKLPFKCPTHHTSSPHRVTLANQPDPLEERSLREILRLGWQAAWHGGLVNLAKECMKGPSSNQDTGYSGPLALTAVDRVLVGVSHLPTAIQHCIYAMESATSHSAMSENVSRLAMYIVCSRIHRVGPVLKSVQWRQVMDRFLQVRPSSVTDEALLSEVLYFICLLLKVDTQPDPDLLTWLSGVLHNPQGALLTLLAKPESVNEELSESALQVRRQLNRQLLKFTYRFIGKMPYRLTGRVSEEHHVRGPVAASLLLRLTVGDTSHFYNLASLERTLLALVHITARPGWSVGCVTRDSLTLIIDILHSLLEVVSAFHFGRGGASMSYMGRGVTRSATLCLRHLTYEMAAQLKDEDWQHYWLFSKQATSYSFCQSGLEWLSPLWTYRDTETRAAGIGLAVALTSTEPGRMTMKTQYQHIAGGIWGLAFSMLLSQSECSLARQQAALLLVNLTSQPLGGSSVEARDSTWEGPIVRDDTSQVSLYGLPALLALLRHSQFYQEVSVMLANYYPQPAIHPVSVATDSSTTSLATTQNTLLTSDVPSSQDEGWQLVTSSLTVGDSYNRPSTVGAGGSQDGMVAAPDPRHLPTPSTTTTSSATTTPTSNVSGGPSSGTTDTSQGTGTVLGYQSVTTPGLVHAITRLLGNLIVMAPDDTMRNLSREGVLKMFIRVIDFSLLEAYLGELANRARRGSYEVSFSDLLRAHSGVLRILHAAVTLEATIRADLLLEVTMLKHCTQLLAISYQGVSDIGALCEQLWEDVLRLFRLMVEHGGTTSLQALTPVLTRHWHTVAARCVNVLQTSTYFRTTLWYEVLHFLAVLLATEGRTCVNRQEDAGISISYRLDNPSKSGVDKRLFSGPSGAILCAALVRVYDAVTNQHGDNTLPAKEAVVSALKCLLVVSTSAKGTALEGGLVESLCNQLQRLTLRLNVDALEVPKLTGTSRRKEQSAVVTELLLTLELLQNFMYNSHDVKVAAYESGVAQIVHRLWAWAQVDPQLMAALLSMLCALTARCPQACSSLAFTSAAGGVIERPVGRGQYSPHSLVHCLIKLAQKAPTGGVSVATTRMVFSILSTLTLSQECRGILWKSNFIYDFASVTPNSTKKTKIQRVLEMCWLEFFVNLSFSTEGQSLILKVKESVPLLVEYASNRTEQHLYCALLVLRNLCFHAANKPKLLANNRVCPLLVRSVELGSDKMRSVASSALLALVFNCQKAKGSLKKTSTVRNLQDTYNKLVYQTGNTWDRTRVTENLHGILLLLRS